MQARTLAGAVATLCLASSVALSQKSSAPMLWEFGADAGISLNHQSGSSSTVLQFPVPVIRAGAYVTPALSIEPALGFSRISGGGSAVTTVNLIIGALYHFETAPTMSQPYVRPFIDYTHQSLSGPGAGSASTTGLGVGLGISKRFKSNPRLGGRAEVNVAHYDTSPGTLTVGVLGGISIFSR
jgi:hypothetical protein